MVVVGITLHWFRQKNMRYLDLLLHLKAKLSSHFFKKIFLKRFK